MPKSALAATLLVLAIVITTDACALRSGTGQPRADDQTRFSSLVEKLRRGKRVRVTLEDCRVEGTVVEFRDDQITIMSEGTSRSLSCPRIERVELRGDPLWNGALIGAAAMAVPAWNACQNKGRNLTCVATGLGLYATIGAFADRSHVGSKTVYVASPGSCAIR